MLLRIQSQELTESAFLMTLLTMTPQISVTLVRQFLGLVDDHWP